MQCALRLTHQAVGPCFGYSADNYLAKLAAEKREAARQKMDKFARNHYEQHMRVTGSLVLPGRLGGELRMEGHGMRDHSWGPRYWQAARSYRFITANFSDNLGLSFSIFGGGGGHGLLVRGRGLQRVKDVQLRTKWDGAGDAGRAWPGVERPMVLGAAHASFVLSFTTRSTPQEHVTVDAEVIGYMPLRNRRGGELTYIGEGMTRYRIRSDAGLDAVGYGLSEYLDQGFTAAASRREPAKL